MFISQSGLKWLCDFGDQKNHLAWHPKLTLPLNWCSYVGMCCFSKIIFLKKLPSISEGLTGALLHSFLYFLGKEIERYFLFRAEVEMFIISNDESQLLGIGLYISVITGHISMLDPPLSISEPKTSSNHLKTIG